MIRFSLRFAALCLLVAVPASAQWSTAPPDSARQDFQRRLLAALDLSPGQDDTLRVLRDRLQQELLFLRDEVEAGALLPHEGRLQYREALNAYESVRDTVLTFEQRQLLERARLHLRDQDLYDGQPPVQVKQRLVDALDMDDLQRRRWQSLLERLRSIVRDRRADGDVLTTDDYRRLREEYRLSFESMLMPDQRLELERIRLARARADEAEPFDLLPDMDAPVEDAWESLESDLTDEPASD